MLGHVHATGGPASVARSVVRRSSDFHVVDEFVPVRKKDAEAYAASVATDLRTGNDVDPAAGKITVGEWADQYLGTLGHLTASSRARTVSVVERHIRPRWGTPALSSVSHAAVLRWVSDLTAHQEPTDDAEEDDQ